MTAFQTDRLSPLEAKANCYRAAVAEGDAISIRVAMESLCNEALRADRENETTSEAHALAVEQVRGLAMIVRMLCHAVRKHGAPPATMVQNAMDYLDRHGLAYGEIRTDPRTEPGTMDYDSPEAYAKANPLGGPARVFERIAERLRAGEGYSAVLADFGLRHISECSEFDRDREDAQRWRDMCLLSSVGQDAGVARTVRFTLTLGSVPWEPNASPHATALDAARTWANGGKR